ncbi:MAG: peptidylprolyl isomerase [Bacteroidetes bacterium]|nr:peptidylprolyl isomerase [Bacteroidota bacterium]
MRPLLLLSGLLLFSCNWKDSANKFSDGAIVKIYEWKDRRLTDSLLRYLKSDQAVYRREAALAFASVQDSIAALPLGALLLEDPDSSVRKCAAFALGQTGGFQSVNALLPGLSDKGRYVVREVLEALGKTVGDMDRGALIEFKSSDTLLQEGLAWAFYQLALRRKADSMVVRRAASLLLPPNSRGTRLGAAHFFGRSAKVSGKGFESALIESGTKDKDAEVRIAAVLGFRHLASSVALPLIRKILQNERDYRVRVSALRALQNLVGEDRTGLLITALHDSSEMVAVAASEVVRNLGLPGIEDEARRATVMRVKANLLGAMLKAGSKDSMFSDLGTLLKVPNPYDRAAILSALGEVSEPEMVRQVFSVLAETATDTIAAKVTGSTAAQALVALNKKARLPDSSFLRVYRRIILSGDKVCAGIVCEALSDPNRSFRKLIGKDSFLYEARKRYQMPRDIESMQPLEEAIAWMEGKDKPRFLKNEFNHPIVWESVRKIPEDQKVSISTNKGEIIMRLVVEDSPASVENFVSLTKQGYFNGKIFHRVVPNFVVQTGCNRGDGYGSEDYSIRSEFSARRYQRGSVGMASAGKDTEGTQWFITHSPTPHLDGRYTIFAIVEEGMGIVDQLEVGDQIKEARLINGNGR